jgi:hypothetical protein
MNSLESSALASLDNSVDLIFMTMILHVNPDVRLINL